MGFLFGVCFKEQIFKLFPVDLNCHKYVNWSLCWLSVALTVNPHTHYMNMSVDVCFSYFVFTFCPLPVSITLSNILSWTVCLRGLSDRFESKKDPPKTGYGVKEVHKKHYPAHTKHNSVKKIKFTL